MCGGIRAVRKEFMKELLLKKVPMKTPAGQDMILDYAEYIKAIIGSPNEGQKGLSVDEMRKSIRVIDAVESARDEVAAFEDADFEYLKIRIGGAKFLFADQNFVDFVESIMAPK